VQCSLLIEIMPSCEFVEKKLTKLCYLWCSQRANQQLRDQICEYEQRLEDMRCEVLTVYILFIPSFLTAFFFSAFTLPQLLFVTDFVHCLSRIQLLILLIFVQFFQCYSSFCALSLWIGWQEGRPDCKNFTLQNLLRENQGGKPVELGFPWKWPLNGVCVCLSVCVCVCLCVCLCRCVQRMQNMKTRYCRLNRKSAKTKGLLCLNRFLFHICCFCICYI